MPNDDSVKVQADRWWSFRQSSIQNSKEYGLSTVRSLILINGAAIIATLTFLSHLDAKSNLKVDIETIKCAMTFYIGGLLFALIVGAIGYFNFQANALEVPDPGHLESEITAGRLIARKSKAIQRTAFVAVVFAVLSFGGFSIGSFVALGALSAK